MEKRKYQKEEGKEPGPLELPGAGGLGKSSSQRRLSSPPRPVLCLGLFLWVAALLLLAHQGSAQDSAWRSPRLTSVALGLGPACELH